MAAGATLIDVRDVVENRHGAIPGSILIPVNELRDRLAEVPHGPVVIHCAVGVRGHTATRILRQLGWADVRNLDGGYTTWAAGTGRHTHRPGSEEAA
jgi:rhodanese-related sulfurtransferase